MPGLTPPRHTPTLRSAVRPLSEGIVLTEFGAILLYLAEKTGKLLPKDIKGRIKTIELVFNQMSSLGPMLGQLLVFRGPWQGGVKVTVLVDIERDRHLESDYLCREGAPLGQGSRASLLVDLSPDEMALLIELVVHLGMN